MSSMSCDERFAVHQDDYKSYDMAKLRRHFLVKDLFKPDHLALTYTHYDRFLVGGVMPVSESVALTSPELLKAKAFLDRRELGVINVGGAGVVEVDGERYPMAYKEALYVGSGAQSVLFISDSAQAPAKFYLNSTPAHHAYPTRKVSRADADVVQMGALASSNERAINKLLVNSVLPTCQLQMGMTELKPGSVWNTMPCHTHSRRMEVYFYFEVPEDQAVCHFMGPANETRHLWLANEQAAVSPPWSIHSGAGTSNYIFIWGMAGENLDYSDMDHLTPAMLAQNGEQA
ncbi:5-dehydro-4-deoxy-D-glucuronate isomerase [Simiduia curdlanivorans]|uniref:4-deoxy-L-threo-5-hexosulose-uronate ketol-isomerase n=1 Tax=Simiduia curdlanivorans TaxID=1492769 RepID=A0ABV8V2Y8_9GAMM|nr:5-dehydro-4-deoxy-D-glucuronate isomerase [Simiduia curdlanivorans]MDN3637548.1 5-dehydro-4-deoxy-D-glucuronate isomerase [Simiduia curdlanivorans]